MGGAGPQSQGKKDNGRLGQGRVREEEWKAKQGSSNAK